MTHTPNMRDVTQERKLLTLAAIRELVVKFSRADGIAFSFILDRLRQLHEQGLWPQADWMYARNDPYDVGTRQHLAAMAREGWLKHDRISGTWRVLKKAPATDPLPEPRPFAERAAELLPAEADVAERLAAFERRFGQPIICGVDFGLNRVVRYAVADADATVLIEVSVEDGDWDRVLTEVGA